MTHRNWEGHRWLHIKQTSTVFTSTVTNTKIILIFDVISDTLGIIQNLYFIKKLLIKLKYNSKKNNTDMLHQKAMQQHSSHCKYCSVIFVIPQLWHAHLKACSTSMLGNTVRFRGRTTPDKIPSVMIFCKTPFNSGDELNNLSSDTLWKLVSCRNILMPVGLELMTDTISDTATDCG